MREPASKQWNNNNNNTYIALIRMRSKRFMSIVLQYDLEIFKNNRRFNNQEQVLFCGLFKTKGFPWQSLARRKFIFIVQNVCPFCKSANIQIFI